MPRQSAFGTSAAGRVTYRRVVPDRVTQPASVSLPPAIDRSLPALRAAILGWYETHGRRLPFRGTGDPFAILVSEAMAQQTQADRAGEAWSRFMAAYPTAPALAAATPADVLRAWQGLGYNRRALNLWRAARRIVEVHGGQVPADLEALRELPGVGPYTARAVMAIAFGVPLGAVDTNVRRVLGRIVAGATGIQGATELQRLADAVIPPDRPAAWTHAVMDLGATICRPRQPHCASCPASAWCLYAASEVARARRPRSHQVSGPPADASQASAANQAIREAPAPFATTTRWLRGRIIDRLRSSGDAGWTVMDGPIGSHDHAAVVAALGALARDGLVELATVDDVGGARWLARLPLG